MLQGVVTGGFDGIENREAAAAEHFEIHAQKRFDGLRQRHAGVKDRAGASNQGFHQRDVSRSSKRLLTMSASVRP